MARRTPTRLPTEVKAHWDRLAQMGCMVCGYRPITIHHAHSRELTAMGLGRGIAQKTSYWLVIGLCVEHHVGKFGIDSGIGIVEWEEKFGSQVLFLKKISELIGYDVFERARRTGTDAR